MQEVEIKDFSPYWDIFSSAMGKAYKRARPFANRKNLKAPKSRLAKGVAVGVALTACLSGVTVYGVQNVIVTDIVTEEGFEKVISFSADPIEIVEKSGYHMKEGDALLLNYFDGKGDSNVIIVLNPFPVNIYRDGKLITSLTAAGTVADILEKSGITLKEGDSLSPRKNEAITEATDIMITSGFPVTVKVDGEKQVVGFPGGTVAEALEMGDISYSADDIIKPALDTVLTKKTTVTIKRVEYKEESETVTTDIPTEIQYSPDMYEDESKVTQKGKKGQEKVTYLVKYIDGERASATETARETLKEAKPKIITKGTKERPRTYVGGTRVFSELTPPFEIELDENNRPVNYKKIITGKATAYCGGGITSTGVAAMPGRIAVDPKQIPYGTKMYIVSTDGKYVYGYCVAADTGGFVKKHSAIADLYMHSYDDCMQFGRRYVDIYILE